MNINEIKAIYNEVSDNWQALDRNVSLVHGEAEDNAIATLRENGKDVWVHPQVAVYVEEFYIHYIGSLETLLACSDCVTEEGRAWFESKGVKY